MADINFIITINNTVEMTVKPPLNYEMQITPTPSVDISIEPSPRYEMQITPIPAIEMVIQTGGVNYQKIAEMIEEVKVEEKTEGR